MSSSGNVVTGVELQMKASRFQQESKKAKNALAGIGQESTKSKNALANYSKQVTASGPPLQGFTQQVRNNSQALKENKVDMAGLGISVLGFGQALGGVSDQVFGFQEKLVALEKSQFGLQETTEDLKRAEEDYAEALNEGFESSREAERALKDLLLLRQKLKIETKEVTAEQEALNSEFVNFGLNLVQTVFFGITTISQLYPILAARINATTLAQHGFTAANIKAAISLKGVRIAMTFVAAHPLMIGALAVVTAATILWSTNLLGVRDAIIGIWDKLKLLFPILQALETVIKNVFPEANAEISELDTAAGDAAGSVKILGNEAATAGNKVTGFSTSVGTSVTQLKGFTSSIGSTANTLVEFYDLASGKGIDDLNQRIDMVSSAFIFMREQGIDPLSPAMLQAKEKMLPEIKAIGKGINTAFGTEALKKFILEMRRVGAITLEEGNKIRKEFGLIKESQSDLKKNFDETVDKIKDKVEEISDFDKILQQNKGIASISRLIEQAAEQARTGNLEGAIFLERQAQLIGRNTASRSGTTQLANFLQRANTSQLGRIFGAETTGSNIAGFLFRGRAVGKRSSIGRSDAGRFGRGGSITIGGRSFSSKGRDRNPLGRNDKLSVRLGKWWKRTFPPNSERRSLMQFMGFKGFSMPRFGNNDPRSFSARRNIITNAFKKHAFQQANSAKRRYDEIFKNVGATPVSFKEMQSLGAQSPRDVRAIARSLADIEGIRDNLNLEGLGFKLKGKFSGSFRQAAFREIQNFSFKGTTQREATREAAKFIGRRAFTRKVVSANVEAFGLTAAEIVNLLRDPSKTIRDNTIREVNDIQAFHNEEKYQTIGTE